MKSGKLSPCMHGWGNVSQRPPEAESNTHLKCQKRVFWGAAMLYATTASKTCHFLCILLCSTKDDHTACVRLPSPAPLLSCRPPQYNSHVPRVQEWCSRTPMAQPAHVPNSSFFPAANSKGKSLSFRVKDRSVHSTAML